MTEINIGYINDDKAHALISIKDAVLTDKWDDDKFSQVVLTIEDAIVLRSKLSDFIKSHQQ
jgi:hypothetical protein